MYNNSHETVAELKRQSKFILASKYGRKYKYRYVSKIFINYIISTIM